MEKIYYHKLIRDRIPGVMKKNGARYSIRKLSEKNFRHELLLKVGEEASALPKLKSKSDITNELGDVIAVINEIKRVIKGIKPQGKPWTPTLNLLKGREETRQALHRYGTGQAAGYWTLFVSCRSSPHQIGQHSPMYVL